MQIQRPVSQSKKCVFLFFLSESHRISIGPQIGKNVQITPYLLVKELISDDLPMEMTNLKLARHSSLTEQCLAKIKHENIAGGSLVISSLT